MNIDKDIAPFYWVDLGVEGASVCLAANESNSKIRKKYTGYEWMEIANDFMSTNREKIYYVKFDPEKDLFSAYSWDPDDVKEFILDFVVYLRKKGFIA